MSLRRRSRPCSAATVRALARGGEGIDVVALATATEQGAPSARMVLLKGADERGFVFHSSYEGRKARELAENPRAALLFHWQEPGRQVRVEGVVERVDRAESEAYFRTRPRGGQLAAWASTQSEVIGSRVELEERFREVETTYERRGSPASPLGRLPPRAGVVRVLGAPRQPAARPVSLSARRGRLADRTARPLN